MTRMTAPVAHIAIRPSGFSQFTLDCDVTFAAGATSVFGPSGSGKTTLLNCIAGLTRPDSGQITVMGTTLFSASERKVVPPEKRRFGYVFQSSALFPNMNVRKNILYGYHLTPEGQRTTDPEQLFDLFDLTRLLDRSVDTLSGGEAPASGPCAGAGDLAAPAPAGRAAGVAGTFRSRGRSSGT